MPDSTSDEILMAAYQAGSEAAFEVLFDRYAGSIYGFVLRRLGDPELAEDLYQEAFLRLHRARQAYDSRRPFRAWLFGIVHNLLADALRSRRRLPETRALHEVRAASAGASSDRARPGDPHDSASGPEHSPETLLANRERSQALSRALSALPSDEATVLILARIEGLPYDDIGSIIGRSPAATKQLAYRALKRIRAELAAGGHPEEA